MNIIIFLHLNKYLHVCGTGLNVCMSCTNLVESGIASEKSVCVTSINNLALEIDSEKKVAWRVISLNTLSNCVLSISGPC